MGCISPCAWHFLFVYFNCQPVHSCIEHQLDFFKITSMETCFCSCLISFLSICYAVPHMHKQLMHHDVCSDKWHPTASTLCPLSLPHKKAQAVSSSYTQSKAQMDNPQIISKEKKKENEHFFDFQPFQFYHFKIVTTHYYYYLRLVQAL